MEKKVRTRTKKLINCNEWFVKRDTMSSNPDNDRTKRYVDPIVKKLKKEGITEYPESDQILDRNGIHKDDQKGFINEFQTYLFKIEQKTKILNQVSPPNRQCPFYPANFSYQTASPQVSPPNQLGQKYQNMISQPFMPFTLVNQSINQSCQLYQSNVQYQPAPNQINPTNQVCVPFHVNIPFNGIPISLTMHSCKLGSQKKDDNFKSLDLIDDRVLDKATYTLDITMTKILVDYHEEFFDYVRLYVQNHPKMKINEKQLIEDFSNEIQKLKGKKENKESKPEEVNSNRINPDDFFLSDYPIEDTFPDNFDTLPDAMFDSSF